MNLVLVRYAETTTHALVHVYLDGQQIGRLDFPKDRWTLWEGKLEKIAIYAGEKVHP